MIVPAATGIFSMKVVPINKVTPLALWSVLDWIAFSSTIVLACSAFDHLDAILNTYPQLITRDPTVLARMQDPSRHEYWVALAKLLTHLPAETDLHAGPIQDLQTAIRLLGPASRSWKTMAALFPTNIRQDLCLLYAFFRTADDLVDDAPTPEQCEKNLAIIRRFLRDVFFATKPFNKDVQDPTLPTHVDWDLYSQLLPSEDVLSVFRSFARVSIYLCPRAMFELTDAWELDIKGEPITSQEGLMRYAALISGTFGELCTCLLMYKTGYGNWRLDSVARKNDTLARARATGQCLQLINIARDVIKDSLDGRCYIPLQYMNNPKQNYDALKKVRNPSHIGERTLKSYALRILELADCVSDQAQRGIEGLPVEVQDGIRAAFEVYMAISPALRNAPGFPIRAKVPKLQQQWIALRCIYGFHGNVARAIHSTCRQLISAHVPAFARLSQHTIKQKKI
ncbi:hypothetical protein DFQ28_009907 [Apophysomyces sp. BC1034]|nr:hypothetical protein DFQ30_009555 [Apophysomyces sp. BC1015]KAG0172103.1 hypothetical protein DFQ29_008528 [Apophysomyces sp. BC1021]KAG0185126.1 hypothetical protein DFQ28_009907 [Apophysomyces sp. BC1034]